MRAGRIARSSECRRPSPTGRWRPETSPETIFNNPKQQRQGHRTMRRHILSLKGVFKEDFFSKILPTTN